MKQRNRTGIVRHAAGVAAVALLAVGCGGSSDGGESEVTVPESIETIEPAAEVVDTVAPVATEAPVVEEVADPTEVPEVPCASYVEESGFPLKPCDSGVLVETLQRDLESLFPAIAIDGLFGGQTFGFIQEIQTANGLESTGLVSEELAGQIAAADSIDGVAAGSATPEESDEAADEPEEAEAEEAAIDPATEELCTGLIGNPDDPNFTAEQIEICSEAGIDLVGEG